MIWRQFRRAAVIGAVPLMACLALSACTTSHADASRAGSSLLIETRGTTAKAGPRRPVAVATPLAVCEERIERQPSRLPTVAIVGASYTAGVGPDNPELSWAVDLARQLRWNAAIYGVPGVGYVRTSDGRGPVARMLSAERLSTLDPALVIVQAGHDDLGVPIALERQRVAAAVDLIRTAAPGARIALMTTFATGSATGSPALRVLDRAIIAAGTSADPGVIVMDPLAGRWIYPRAADGLHPTAAGDAWLARKAATILAAHGVRPAPATSTAPIICDTTVGVGKPTLS